MATIAEFWLPADGFPLGATIEADPAIRIEFERIIPADEGIVPFFCVWDANDFDAFERTLLETQAVRSLEKLSRVDSMRLYRARWNPSVEGFVHGIAASGATILDGRGTADGWRFELRFTDRAGIRRFQRYCEQNDVPITLQRVYTVRDARSGERYGLTDDQRETLHTAYERGYFEEPRGVTQSELADEFDVSQRAVSRRLRRALSRLVGNTVALEDGPS
ncbi:helix-turn-helix domain-containing protein [Natribaculum luteum]|uniref:Helix-turn-helix domain-containing protein n=1 Tax=Natribaculum luteum TaxID=1586232 RepID=A0ABD5NYZ6_9EURY|nr:helix-turn-helix domain-containing protein [Natribaculum luteum]